MRSERTRLLVEIALTVALSAVLSMLAVRLPINFAGGTISLSMVPILVLALRRGVVPGVIAGVLFGCVDLLIEPFVVAPVQVLLDYPIAFGAVGLAGLGAALYRREYAQSPAKAVAWAIPFILLGGAARFAAAWTSGVVFFGQNAPAGQPVWLYSLVYNLSYLVPSIALCAVAAAVVLPCDQTRGTVNIPTCGIVRMRALLVCAARVKGSCTLVARLAPNFDYVIAVDGGGDICLEGGVTPDVLVGDLDSATSDTIDALIARGVPVQRYPAEKDATDLELAIGEARRQGAGEIVVTAATAGRLDHTLGALAALAAAADLRPEVVEPDLSGWLLARGGRRELTLSGVGATVSMLPWGGVALVSSRGVRWPLDHAELGPESTRGVSNVISSNDGGVFSVHQGTALVISSRGDLPPASKFGR